ncbi:MAG: hypothetical protein QF879_04880 [Candidatus Latescibacteria bacterium]|nr:hypothetical protein [Candidatus Latescibacterota bacterium]
MKDVHHVRAAHVLVRARKGHSNGAPLLALAFVRPGVVKRVRLDLQGTVVATHVIALAIEPQLSTPGPLGSNQPGEPLRCHQYLLELGQDVH